MEQVEQPEQKRPAISCSHSHNCHQGIPPVMDIIWASYNCLKICILNLTIISFGDFGHQAIQGIAKATACSICSTCPTHSVERNGTRPMVWADRYGRSAPVTRESGQSQFAPLKLRSLALVPSSGAQSAPSKSTYGSSTVRLFLPR